MKHLFPNVVLSSLLPVCYTGREGKYSTQRELMMFALINLYHWMNKPQQQHCSRSRVRCRRKVSIRFSNTWEKRWECKECMCWIWGSIKWNYALDMDFFKWLHLNEVLWVQCYSIQVSCMPMSLSSVVPFFFISIEERQHLVWIQMQMLSKWLAFSLSNIHNISKLIK